MTPKQRERLARTPLGQAKNRLRAALEITEQRQVDVCRATGIPAPNLSEIVNGRYEDLNLKTCQRLAQHFDVTVDVLFPSRAA